MIQHRGPISGIAAHRDRYVATAGYDNQVILWDQQTKRAMTRVVHDHLANQCSFSADGGHLVTSSSDHTARLWSVPDMRLLAVLGAQEDDVEMSVFHPTEQLIATASRDHRVRVYDFHGNILATLRGHTADVISVEWVDGKDELISSSDDGTVKRWSLASAGPVEDIDMAGVETDSVVIAADGTIFAGNDAGEITVIRGGATEPKSTVIQAHDAGIKRLVLAADRALLASLSYDRTMRLWDVGGAQPRQIQVTDIPHDVWPRSAAFAGSSGIVFGTFGATYRTYDHQRQTWDDQAAPVTLGVNAVDCVGPAVLTVGDAGIVWRDGARLTELGSLCNFLTPACGLVFTGGQLGRLFDAQRGTLLHQHRSPLNCGAGFARAGADHAIIGSYTGEGLVFRRRAGNVEHLTDVSLHTNAIKGIATSDALIFSVCADGSAAWHSADTFEEVHRVPDAHDKIANGCVSLGGNRFASVSRDRKLRVWDERFQPRVIDTPHTHSIKCVAASPDGRLVATGAYNGRVAVHDLDAGEWTIIERPTASGISCLASGPRAGFLASSYDGQVYSIGR